MIETGADLAAAAKNVAENYKTLYVRGCFGWPMNEHNKGRSIQAYAYNRKEARQEMIQNADSDTFGFDCVCLIKALLWGWCGIKEKNYGGAVYCANGVPDKNADQMIKLCQDVSEDFANLRVGEALWLKGHIGLYIGGGLAVECTPSWKNGVQITAVHNIGKKSGYNGRIWTKHGKLPYVRYQDGDCRITLPYLCKGMAGEEVRALQILLMGNGLDCGSSGADGEFGPKTLAALEKYQLQKGLEADGVVGPESYSALMGVR